MMQLTTKRIKRIGYILDNIVKMILLPTNNIDNT